LTGQVCIAASLLQSLCVCPMALAAWAKSSSHNNQDNDGEMDETYRTSAWVFPEGLEVGRSVQFYSSYRNTAGYARYNAVSTTEIETLAIGMVESVDGDRASFKWKRAAKKQDSGPWEVDSPPTGKLVMEPSESSHYNDRRGRAFDASSNKACRHDGYKIHVPKEAWDLLATQTFVLTLNSWDVVDNQRLVQLSTLGGNQLEFRVPKDSFVRTLVPLVIDACQLGRHTEVMVINADGIALEPDMHIDAMD